MNQEIADSAGQSCGRVPRWILVPQVIADAGDKAARRFARFLRRHIENNNTRAAYHARLPRFFAWCDIKGIADLVEIEPLHVAAYIEAIGKDFEKPTVKQHLAAIRMLFDWLVVGQVVAINPAHSVRGPKHVIKRGKTPVLTPAEARQLLDSIDISTRRRPARSGADRPHGLFAFARISAAIGMRVEDYYPPGQALVGAPARKRRQAPRNAVPPQSRSLP